MSSRGEIRAIARRAMIPRGLLPDFSPAVVAETAATIRDPRGLLWCSIDNDSRDLNCAIVPRGRP